MSKLLSVSILFRHGARGPGDSETSAWEEHDPVVNQWEEHEMENLSTVGPSSHSFFPIVQSCLLHSFMICRSTDAEGCGRLVC